MTTTSLKLYNKINEIACLSELLPGDDTVGYLNVQEYNECTDEETPRCPRLGITYTVEEFMFIVIFRKTNNGKLTVFRTLIHEMVHLLQYKRAIKGTAHEKEYRNLGKEVSKLLQAKLHEFEKPYCNLVIDEQEIFNARS